MVSTCTGFIQPLNLECTVINFFAGTIDIFFFISFIVIAMLAARFKMTNGPALLLFGIFAIIFSTYIQGIYLLVILIGGIVIFFAMKAPFSRD